MTGARFASLTDVAGLGIAEEHLEELAAGAGWRLERIVSRGQTTPADEWYDQDCDEWVVLIAGGARLQVEGMAERSMAPGDSVWLPARCRHRVTWTDPASATVWVALFADPIASRV